ncbi:uncharacterized protein F13E9.13, mitochondrial-like isoform X2 [Dromaius novaehollandiae]|uniref:uncharacterized protein F13E9.13, mitochondrial-like isoform X2 n=1 Tax=Dromaius novaehollandiae TaxID=8790 RepID=UPI00311F9F4F
MALPRLLGRPRSAVVGVVHAAALPGTPRSSLPLAQIVDQACQEAETYRDAGVDGLIIENMHDLPYTVCPGPEITAAMTVISAAVKRTCPRLPLGVQILCAANQQAIAVALATGLDFIRAEGFVFSHVADEGIINACAGNLLRYRKQIGAENIQIFADIKKKHSAHALTADVSVAETARAAELFLADGVVLTGTATALPADPQELKDHFFPNGKRGPGPQIRLGVQRATRWSHPCNKSCLEDNLLHVLLYEEQDFCLCFYPVLTECLVRICGVE